MSLPKSGLTPTSVCFGRGQTILLDRERIERNTVRLRRVVHHRHAA